MPVCEPKDKETTSETKASTADNVREGVTCIGAATAAAVASAVLVVAGGGLGDEPRDRGTRRRTRTAATAECHHAAAGVVHYAGLAPVIADLHIYTLKSNHTQKEAIINTRI